MPASLTALTLLASLTPTTPALAETPSSPTTPSLVSQFTSWASSTVAGWFTEDPEGETRPSTRPITLPGRDTSQAAQRKQAAPPGKRVKEVPGKRSRFASVYELEDGRLQAEVSTRPVSYQDSKGNWQPIDTRIEANSEDGFVHGNDKAGYGTRFGDKSDKLVRIKIGEHQLTLGVPGAARPLTPKVDGSTVTYPSVWDGADLVYKVTQEGVKEYLALSKAPAAGTSFAFTVKTGGLTAQEQPDESIAFLGEDGTPAFTIPKPFMIDAEADAASPYGKRSSDAVTQTVQQQGDEATITLAPDAGWLAAPDRKWPVVIDPTIRIQPEAAEATDTYIDSAKKSTNFDEAWNLPVGKTSAGAINRALLHFNLPMPLGTQVDQARLETYFDQALGEAGPVTVEAREITGDWDSWLVTWNNQPAVATTAAATVTRNPGELSRWHSFDVTGVVNKWMTSEGDTPGFMLKAADESTTGKVGGPVYEAAADVYGGDGMTGETVNFPKLVVTYGTPSVTLKPVTTATSVGASLSWTAYQDPTPGNDADDLVGYELYRHCPSGCQLGNGTSSLGDELVTTLPTDITSYTDTSSGGDPDAVSDPSYVHEATYWVTAVLKNGQRSPSQELTVILPRPGKIAKTLYGSADTTLASGEPSIAHDVMLGQKRLQVGNTATAQANTRAVVKFDDFAAEIPADAQISQTTLSLWGATSTGSGASFTAHKLTKTFDETATWTNPWTTAGGDFDAAALGTVTAVTATPGWRRWTVTDAAKAWVSDPASNKGLLVKVANEAGTAKQSASFLATEADESVLRPRLRVEYAEKTSGSSAFYVPGTPERLNAGESRELPVVVTNTTAETWTAASTAVSYHWQLPDGTDISTADNQLRKQLPTSLAPGESTVVYATVKAPTASSTNLAEGAVLVWDVQDTVTNNWKSATHHLPELPQQIRVDSPTSDLLGLEKFYAYTGKNTGAGTTALVNPYAGNVVWSYNAFSNPSRGPQTFARMTYNSLDTSTASLGYGWSLQTSTLAKLGSQLQFHPPGQDWPSQVRLTDGDGTTHVWTLPEGTDTSTCNPSTCAYKNPRGVHLYLQQVARPDDPTRRSTDPLRQWVFTKPDRTQFFFDDEGFQSAIVDKNGNTMSFTYERRRSNNKPTKFLQYITDATGRKTLSLSYYKKGQNYTYIDDTTWQPVDDTKLTNPHIIDNVESITDIAGRKVTFDYTDKGLMARMIDGAGDEQAKTFRFRYDATQGNKNVKLVSVKDPRGNDTDLKYYEAPVDPKDLWKIETLTDRLDGVTKFDYVDPDGPQGGVINATVTDPLQHPTKYVLDAYGRPESITNAKNETTSLQWDPDHNVVKLTEANQAYATWAFDQKTGYPLELKDAEANKNGTTPTTLVYQTGLNGYVADLIEKTSPEGRKWKFGYDAKGNLKTVTDPLGVETATVDDYTTKYDYDGYGQLLKSTDANTNPTTFGDYDPTGYPKTITDAYNNVTTTVYDVRGNVLSVTDALGKKTTQTYDVFKRPLESKVPKDQDKNDFIVTPAPVYDRNDNITKSTAPNGAVATAAYDAADQLTESLLPKDSDTSPERKATFTWDLAGNLKTQTEPKGNLAGATATDFTTTYVYDPIYQLTDVLNADQHKITYEYDNVGNTTKVIDPRKNATADAADYTATYTYDLNHQVKTSKDAAGFVTSVDYDLDGLVVGQTDQENNKTITTYDKRGAVIETKVPHANVDGDIKYITTQYAYDQVGNKTKTITPRGVETADDPTDFIAETKYDKLNRPVEEIYPFDKDDPVYNQPDSVTYAYDEVSQLKEISAPPSHGQTIRNITKMTYWDNGWSRTTTDPWDIKTTYDYNKLGLQTNRTVTSAGGSSQRALDWDYYPDGKLKTHSDNGVPLGLDVVLEDNSDTGQVVATGSWTPTSGASASNIAGPQVAASTGFVGYDYATAPAGTGQSSFTWNLTTPTAGTYKVAVQYPSGATATNAKYTVKHDGGTADVVVDQTKNAGTWVELGSYTFTAGTAHSITLTDAANGTVVADAVKLVRDPGGANDTEKKDFSYTYDVNANLTQIDDNSPTAKIDLWDIAYTNLNQIEKIQEKLDGVLKNTTTYDYNENSAVTVRTHDKTVATYGYDVRDLVNQVVNKKTATDPSPKTTAYTYTPRAERQSETKANNNTVTYDYFLSGVLRHSVEKKPNAAIVAEHTIGYQGNLQRASDHAKIQNADNPGAYLDNTYAYTYDPRDRIAKTVKTPTGGGTAETETYSHDPNSNVWEEEVLGKKTTFTYDRNRLMTSVTNGQTSTYTYDPYGRLRTIQGGGKTWEKYTYDGFDHVTKHEKLGTDGATSTVTTYTYDPLDRTTTKTEKEGTASAKTTTYSYLGLSGEVLDEEVAGKLTKSFQYSPWGERLSQVKIKADSSEESSYYGYNPHTDVEQITADTGDTRATYGYTAYGKNDDKLFTGVDKPDPVDPTAKEEYNPYRFNAKRWDNSTGMYDMGFRDYNPGLNRFLSLDSYNGALDDLALGLDPWTSNRYTFAGGNPIGGIEIDGHDFWDSAASWLDNNRDNIRDAALSAGEMALGAYAAYEGISISVVGAAACPLTAPAAGGSCWAVVGGVAAAAVGAAAMADGADRFANIRWRQAQTTSKGNTPASKGSSVKPRQHLSNAEEEALEGQIDYGAGLSKKAIEFRKSEGITGGRNVSVWEYVDLDGNIRTISRVSKGRHAEKIIRMELEELGIPDANVRRIYTEYSPCDFQCDKWIGRYKNAKVTYSFQYNPKGATRRKAVRDLKKAVKEALAKEAIAETNARMDAAFG
ncbi:DNRLRE domain-containing protein [Actinomadura sp. ATCC 31491]|uniref:DNRLRE domain-containing protein n=1 Tax=Actinomadura luzonensis TaxID=2805427 RepID=A0ABT0FVK3_9ACTN|nr:DNRLRE domain-containing protein [Actinomadura luzonensis]MCK2216365.1 DNRLRE domain-containing protein [Actinomadura luzonensis]